MQIALLCGSQEAGSNLMVKALYQMEREIVNEGTAEKYASFKEIFR
jgi:hypothetical protein